MCGQAATTCNGQEVWMFLGDAGGELEFGNVVYQNTFRGQDERQPMIDTLMELEKQELVNLILDLVDNGKEA